MILLVLFILLWLVLIVKISTGEAEDILMGFVLILVFSLVFIVVTLLIDEKCLEDERILVLKNDVVMINEDEGIYLDLHSTDNDVFYYRFLMVDEEGFKSSEKLTIKGLRVIEEKGIEQPYYEKFTYINKGFWKYVVFCLDGGARSNVLHIPPKSADLTIDVDFN